MDLILLVSIVILFFGSKISIKKPNKDYISREQTLCINGFFVLVVFMRHFKGYVELGKFDKIFSVVDGWTGQLIVVPFLFFSGYGIMLSIMKKGKPYVNSIMTKRFWSVWLRFAFAVSLFIPVNLFLGNQYPLKKILLSLVGWDGIGNSNWYIFDTLVLYVLTFVSFKLFSKDKRKALYVMFLLTGVFLIFMSKHRPGYWYNTAIAYPLGMFYAQIEPTAGAWLKKLRFNQLSVLTLGAVLLAAASFHKSAFTSYELFVTGFAIVVLVLSTFVKVGNPLLRFFGKYVFEIYILQRIPMLLMKNYVDNKYILFALSFAATIALALLFRLLTDTIEKLADTAVKKLRSKAKS